jgi:hypothetical protein
VNCAQFLAFLNQGGPDLVHHAVAAPALEPAVEGGVVAELFGQAVPLAAGAEAVDDAVEDGAPILGGLAAFGAGLPVLFQDGLDASPEFIGDLPEGLQRLGCGALAGHRLIPPSGSTFIPAEAVPDAKAGSEIVS